MNWMARCFVPQQLALRHKLGNCYDWHKFVWSCFPGRAEAKRDFLFRLEAKPEGALLHILGQVQPVRPEQLPEASWECREIPAGFLHHNAYRFDVICNPGRKVTMYNDDGTRRKNSRREAIVHEHEQKAWFEGKAEACGFSLAADSLRIDPCQASYFHKKTDAGTRVEGTHIGVRFCGALHVKNREQFCSAFSLGIGSARSFGFGLLLLAPLHHL